MYCNNNDKNKTIVDARKIRKQLIAGEKCAAMLKKRVPHHQFYKWDYNTP